MGHPVADQLLEYYRSQDIHPENFNCCHGSYCRKYSYQGKMTETKMSLVGNRYGERDIPYTSFR
jgi:hypothetical protein